MGKVLVAGVAVLDFVFKIGSFPKVPEKYRAQGAYITGGGNAGNAAVAIARLGGIAQLATRIGDDPVADLIYADLQKEGVRTDLVKRFENRQSSFSSIYIDDAGERQIMNFRDTDISMDAGWLESEMPAFDVALADTRWPQGAHAAMKAAKRLGKPGVIDAEAPVMEAEDAVREASHVAFSAQGIRDFCKCNDVEEAALRADNELDGRVFVTDGPNGTLQIVDQKPIWHSTPSVQAIDTLAAGDVWHGAFALALAENQNEDQAISMANHAASLKCSRPDGRNGAPSRIDVTKFMEAKK